MHNCIQVSYYRKQKWPNAQVTVKRGYSEKEGPFVKILDNALQSFGVQRQQYFGGAFIGNHVQKALKVQCYTIHVDMNNSYCLKNYQVPNIQTLCTIYISVGTRETAPPIWRGSWSSD